jgi:inosose dehydratase
MTCKRTWAGLVAALLGTALATATSEPATARPKDSGVAVQLYIWTQYYGERHSRLEDHLDDVFAATRRAGFEAVQGFLNFYDSPASTTRVAGLLKQHRQTMPAAYAGGAMHTRAAGQQTILQITRQARLGVSHGLRLVVHNPQPLGRTKTDEELAIQADNLNRLGAALGVMGVRLALHNHDPEMRSGAREWYYMLRHTDPDKVGICLDLDWVRRGGQDPYRLLQDAGPRLLDLHLRNSHQGVWAEDLGSGDIDYTRAQKILSKLNYRGWYTVELAYEGKTVRTRSLEEDLARSRDFVRRVFQIPG